MSSSVKDLFTGAQHAEVYALYRYVRTARGLFESAEESDRKALCLPSVTFPHTDMLYDVLHRVMYECVPDQHILPSSSVLFARMLAQLQDAPQR